MNNKKPLETLQEAIEEGLSLLGESGKKSIIFHIEKNFKIRMEEAPYKIQEFVNALRKIFGPGARYIEQAICKNLYKKTGLKIDNPENFDLVRIVEELKNQKEAPINNEQ
ncbi:hypothetical protein H5T51_09250 [Candidatus Bathyarchaeota archaeon]|nr:hypothetical protein [Candidatus Bathyarchaeota archaeon]